MKAKLPRDILLRPADSPARAGAVTVWTKLAEPALASARNFSRSFKPPALDGIENNAMHKEKT
jgi:hypothetical protein